MLSLCVLFSSERFDGKRNLKRSVQRERLSRRNLPLRNNNAGAVSLSRPSLSSFKAFQRGENEREIDARVVRREILIAGGGFKIAPERSVSSRARTRCSLFLSLFMNSGFITFISSFTSDSVRILSRSLFAD